MKCLQCKTEVEQTPGKKARLYCNDACRMKHKRTPINEQTKANTITEQSNTNTPPPKDTELREDTRPQDYTTVEGICLKCRRVMKHGIEVNLCFEFFRPTYTPKRYD